MPKLRIDGDGAGAVKAVKARVDGGEKLTNIVKDAQARAAVMDSIASLEYIDNLEKQIYGSSGAFERHKNVMFQADPTFRSASCASNGRSSSAVPWIGKVRCCCERLRRALAVMLTLPKG